MHSVINAVLVSGPRPFIPPPVKPFRHKGTGLQSILFLGPGMLLPEQPVSHKTFRPDIRHGFSVFVKKIGMVLRRNARQYTVIYTAGPHILRKINADRFRTFPFIQKDTVALSSIKFRMDTDPLRRNADTCVISGTLFQCIVFSHIFFLCRCLFLSLRNQYNIILSICGVFSKNVGGFSL